MSEPGVRTVRVRDGYADPVKYAARLKRKYENNRETYARNRRAWRAADRRRARAHSAVARALRQGLLQMPLFCPLCGEDRRLDAHHADYDKPLEVTWTCRSCHKTNLV